MSDREPLHITSVNNRRIVETRKLGQRKQRESQGRFLVEGLQLIHMALDAKRTPLEVFYCPEQFSGSEAPTLLDRARAAGADVIAVSAQVMASLCERDLPQGLVATFALFETPLESLSLTGVELVVVVDRLQDPGNLGTLIRTADAVGASAVALIEPCVDPFDPKTVRGTMGSLFNVPLVRASDVGALFAHLRRQGLRAIGADAHLGVAWGQGLWRGGCALVLGNEARGLSSDVREHIEQWAYLPMVGGAESLNVSVAGGVLMYAWLRENIKQSIA